MPPTALDQDTRAALALYLRKALDPELELESVRRLSGGASNEMYLLELTDRAPLVVRRPPSAKSAPTAHNVVREHTILSALEHTDVPHPRSLHLCTDEAVIGAPFLVMEHIDGYVLERPLIGENANPSRLRERAFQFIDGLAQIARADWRAAGLESFGKPAGFLDRQVARWLGQLGQYQSRPLPQLELVCGWLRGNQPKMGAPGILHGDYQFLNVIYHRDGGRIAAIVDWEQSTIGDPLLDLGWVLGMWAEPGERSPVDLGTWTTQLPGMPRRGELAERYAQASGRSLVNLRYYEVLALFKLACILEGLYARHLRATSDFAIHADFEWMVPRLLETAADIARGERD